MTNPSYLIVEVRNGRRQITPDEGIALFQTWRQEGARPEFDGATYYRLWLLLEHSPAVEGFTRSRSESWKTRTLSYRGSAAFYLLHAYPEQRDAFIVKYDADPDPEVQNALAFAEALTHPISSHARWTRILETPGISWDLADTVQLCLAYAPSSEQPAAKAQTHKENQTGKRRDGGGDQTTNLSASVRQTARNCLP